MGPLNLYGLIGLVQRGLAHHYVVLGYCRKPSCRCRAGSGRYRYSRAATRCSQLDRGALSSADRDPRGAVVFLRLTLKRRKLPHCAFDPRSELSCNLTTTFRPTELSHGPNACMVWQQSRCLHPCARLTLRFACASRMMALLKSCRMATSLCYSLDCLLCPLGWYQ